jgi:hypothetical protein
MTRLVSKESEASRLVLRGLGGEGKTVEAEMGFEESWRYCLSEVDGMETGSRHCQPSTPTGAISLLPSSSPSTRYSSQTT